MGMNIQFPMRRKLIELNVGNDEHNSLECTVFFFCSLLCIHKIALIFRWNLMKKYRKKWMYMKWVKWMGQQTSWWRSNAIDSPLFQYYLHIHFLKVVARNEITLSALSAPYWNRFFRRIDREEKNIAFNGINNDSAIRYSVIKLTY